MFSGPSTSTEIKFSQRKPGQAAQQIPPLSRHQPKGTYWAEGREQQASETGDGVGKTDAPVLHKPQDLCKQGAEDISHTISGAGTGGSFLPAVSFPALAFSLNVCLIRYNLATAGAREAEGTSNHIQTPAYTASYPVKQLE